MVRTQAPPIHSHVWHLYSQILAGSYSETLYEEITDDSTQAEIYHCAEIDYLVNRNVFEAVGEKTLRPTSHLTVTAGENHTVPAGIPHETHIEESSFVATLLITSAPQATHASVYSKNRILEDSYDRPVLHDAEKFALLAKLTDSLYSP
ncbi:hypothetical protein GCM10009784_27120 [Arthrobacter parietis]|uniref:Cupin n=1 Tax=Arthrobacter parietis TaxID=271434 RepID=A0ABN3B0P2_9MICC